MKNELTIGFEFLEDFYYSLVEVKESDGYTEYEIRLMDDRLTRLINEDHVIREKDGYLQLPVRENDSMLALKRKGAESLSQFLRKPMVISCEPQS
ncbi:MAG: hypothetical protein ABI151_07055 [Chitinophagaceae bacterium]